LPVGIPDLLDPDSDRHPDSDLVTYAIDIENKHNRGKTEPLFRYLIDNGWRPNPSVLRRPAPDDARDLREP